MSCAATGRSSETRVDRKEADASRPTRSEAQPSEGRRSERERIASARVRQSYGRSGTQKLHLWSAPKVVIGATPAGTSD